MKITEVSADALGVKALIAAAEAVQQLVEARNINLAVIEGTAGSGKIDTLVVFSRRDGEAGPPFTAVTVEPKPRVLYIEADPVEHSLGGCDSHLSDGHCVCDATGCCNDEDGFCVCPECTAPGHTRHPA